MFKEYYIYSANFLPLASGTGVAFTDTEVRIDPDSDFEFVKTSHIATSNAFRLKYRDDSTGRYLQKGSQDARLISGTIFNVTETPANLANHFVPFVWPRPYIISGATTFTVSASDVSGSSNTIRMAFHGNKIRQGQAPWDRKYRAMVPYVYAFSTTATIQQQVVIAANDTASVAIPTDKDGVFLCHKIVGTRTGSALITIKDGSRDRQWMDASIHIDNLIGSAQFPNVLTAPRFVDKGAVISMQIQDTSGAQNTIEISLIGCKLFE